jgi:hypothetical protein
MQAVITWEAPAPERPSPDYTVEANGTPVFVYQAPVRTEILRNDGLWTHAPAAPAERASFAIFDMQGEVEVSVRPGRPFRDAEVLPREAGVKATARDGEVRFTMAHPRHLTLVLDGSDRRPLHLFVGEPEQDVPDPGDPDVVYFGPGVHEIEGIEVKSGQTVYLAGGAVVRAKLAADAAGQYSEQWKVTFHSGCALSVQDAQNVRIRGRGILDGGLVPHPGWNLVRVNRSRDVRVEGIMLRDAPNWNMIIRQSEGVRVSDVRIISGRLNSDGINSVNSRRVDVAGCFVRNHDDSIVVKTLEPDHPAENIRVSDCTVWNDWGYALGVTYETRSAVRDVAFENCRILFARHWCMGLHVSDSATVSDIRFLNIHVDDVGGVAGTGDARDVLTHTPKLLRFVVTRDVWGKDAERGRIRDVTVDGVTVHGGRALASEMAGSDGEHDIRGVRLLNIRQAGRPPATDAAGLGLSVNEHVRDVEVGPAKP